MYGFLSKSCSTTIKKFWFLKNLESKYFILLGLFIALTFSITFPTDSYAIGVEAHDKESNLIISSDTPQNQFEFGILFIPLLLSNLTLLTIGVLNYKKKLPVLIKAPINFIFNFEISRKVAVIVITSLLILYIGFSVEELQYEETLGDFPGVKKNAENFVFENVTGVGPHLRYFLLHISLNFFGNIRIIPFIASITLLILTYYITFKISEKRFAGIVAMIILLQSHLFLEYDTTATYTNFWTLFYLLSLYLIYKKWYLSPIAYVLSIFSKPLTAVFLPMTLFFTYRSNISKRNKLRILFSYSIIAFASLLLFLFGIYEFHLYEISVGGFITGFKDFSNFLRFDVLIILFLLPLVVGLFLTSRKGCLQAESIMVLIVGVLLSGSLLSGFTDLTNQPYRYVPFVVFFAIGVGTLLSQCPTSNIEKKSISYLVFSISLAIVTFNLVSVIFPALIQGQYRVVI